jgi:hypothetical protein
MEIENSKIEIRELKFETRWCATPNWQFAIGNRQYSNSALPCNPSVDGLRPAGKWVRFENEPKPDPAFSTTWWLRSCILTSLPFYALLVAQGPLCGLAAVLQQ